MTGTGGRAPRPGQIRRHLYQDLVGLPEFAALPLKRLDPLAFVRGRSGSHGHGHARLAAPGSLAFRSSSRTSLRSSGSIRPASRARFGAPTRSALHARGSQAEGQGSLPHGSILARSGASGTSGAVQSRAASITMPSLTQPCLTVYCATGPVLLVPCGRPTPRAKRTSSEKLRAWVLSIIRARWTSTVR